MPARATPGTPGPTSLARARAEAARRAIGQVGKPYRWGATGPATFDRSGAWSVGMYVGQGLMVHAPHTGALVRVDAMRPSGYAGATRPRSG